MYWPEDLPSFWLDFCGALLFGFLPPVLFAVGAWRS